MEKLEGVYFLKLLLVGLLLYASNVLLKRAIDKILEKNTMLDNKRKETFRNVAKHSLTGIAILFFLFYAVSPFIDFNKILAGAGVVGIVIGFASQNMLKDLIAGFFRISTKQLRSGDLVMINGKVRGRVEEMGLLYLQIREWDGKLTTFNNGEVREIQNFNIDKMRIIVNIVASFHENPEKVKKVLEEVCQKLNDEHSHLLLEGEEEQSYQWYGLTDTNAQFLGYQYTIVGLVKDDVYFDALNHARLIVAQAMYDNGIQMATLQANQHIQNQLSQPPNQFGK